MKKVSRLEFCLTAGATFYVSEMSNKIVALLLRELVIVSIKNAFSVITRQKGNAKLFTHCWRLGHDFEHVQHDTFLSKIIYCCFRSLNSFHLDDFQAQQLTEQRISLQCGIAFVYFITSLSYKFDDVIVKEKQKHLGNWNDFVTCIRSCAQQTVNIKALTNDRELNYFLITI